MLCVQATIWVDDFSANLASIDGTSCCSISLAWIINTLSLHHCLSCFQTQYFLRGYPQQKRKERTVYDTGTTLINYLLATHGWPSLALRMTVHWCTVQKMPGTVFDGITFKKVEPACGSPKRGPSFWMIQKLPVLQNKTKSPNSTK